MANQIKQGLQLAFVYIGLVIGAGFASGREILEYFNFKSITDCSGVVLAAFLFITVCYLILLKAHKYHLHTYDDYLDAVAGRGAGILRMFMALYMFCGLFVMFAGSGALLSQTFMLPSIVGIFVMAVLCFVVLSCDLKGIVTLNLILVPMMIGGILYLCIYSIVFGDTSVFLSFEGITRNILVSAICYVSYNTITAASVLVPLQQGLNRRGILISAVAGGFILGLLITVIWGTLSLNFDALWDSEIPMLKLAAIHGRLSKYIYSLVLFMSIATTAVSQGFGLLNRFSGPQVSLRSRALISGGLCLAAIPFALLGFSNLVARLYSFFGYMGLLWMLWVIIDFYCRR